MLIRSRKRPVAAAYVAAGIITLVAMFAPRSALSQVLLPPGCGVLCHHCEWDGGGGMQCWDCYIDCP